ncbi:TPA: hypothetical protein SFZ51_000730 [Campylobacter jejuni]|nr:hypothetical protein [Campylobacter jejuni]HEG8104731.1 hypothetical protein [Campylobacter jejuni]HEG8133619.1 hypothetical protein [Campylobacter jejuni]
MLLNENTLAKLFKNKGAWKLEEITTIEDVVSKDVSNHPELKEGVVLIAKYKLDTYSDEFSSEQLELLNKVGYGVRITVFSVDAIMKEYNLDSREKAKVKAKDIMYDAIQDNYPKISPMIPVEHGSMSSLLDAVILGLKTYTKEIA